MVRFERAGRGHADVVGLRLGELGQLHAQLVEVQPCDLLVQVLGQDVDLLLVLAGVGPQLELRQDLVGEAGRHDEARMAGGAAQVDQAPLRQKDQLLAVGELHWSTCGFTLSQR